MCGSIVKSDVSILFCVEHIALGAFQSASLQKYKAVCNIADDVWEIGTDGDVDIRDFNVHLFYKFFCVQKRALRPQHRVSSPAKQTYI